MLLLSRLRDSISPLMKLPRATLWALVALVLLAAIGLVSAVQLPVVLYKAALVALGAVLGYWVDRGLFPYSRPDGYLVRDWRRGTNETEGAEDFPVVAGCERVFMAALIRRAIVAAAVILALATGL